MVLRSESVTLGQEESTVPGIFLELQILGPHSNCTESETQEVGSLNLGFKWPTRYFWCFLRVENQSRSKDNEAFFSAGQNFPIVTFLPDKVRGWVTQSLTIFTERFGWCSSWTIF